VNVICELARKNPKNYLPLAPIFFKLMTTSTNNWMLIKIIKLVSADPPHWPPKIHNDYVTFKFLFLSMYLFVFVCSFGQTSIFRFAVYVL